MYISVVIVTWNVKDLLRDLLESLERMSRQVAYEVFVVDNNSSDGSADMVRTAFPAVHLIALSENKGFAGGNNEALHRVSGRYVLFLNPDTRLTDDAIRKMYDFMEMHPEAAGLGCRLVYPDGSLQMSCRHFPSVLTDFFESVYLDHIFPGSPLFNRYRMGMWKHDTVREVDQPYGACLLFKKDVLDKVGLMDERFFMYYDEVDLCYRVKKTGGRIFFSPDITIIHYANQSSNQAQDACEYYKAKSRFLFFGKHYGRMAQVLLFANLVVRTFIVWCVFPLTRVLVRRPRSLGFFQKPVGVLWKGYVNALRKGGRERVVEPG